MEKKRLWKPLLIGLLTAFAVLYTLPTFVPEGALPEWYPFGILKFDKRLNFGLDLKGGLELRYMIDYKAAIRDNSRNMREAVLDRVGRELAKQEGKDPETLPPAELAKYAGRAAATVVAFDTIEITFANPADGAVLTGDLTQNIDPAFVRIKVDDQTFRLRLREQRVAEIKESVVNQTLDQIRKRVEAFGLVEPDVRKSGDSEIDVQMPGVKKEQMEMVRQRIGQTAQLTFRIVDEESTFVSEQGEALDRYKQEHPDRAQTLSMVCPGEGTAKRPGCFLRSEKKSEILAFLKTVPRPDDHMFGFQEVEERGQSDFVQERYWRTYFLFAKIELSGDTLSRAMVLYEPQGDPYVSLELNGRGATIFAEVTRKFTKKDMAIMLDDEVNSAPNIKEEITGGRAKITLGGNRSPQDLLREARSLVTVLNQGAYKAPVHKVHDNEVGPSLGRDAIRSGSISMIVGAALVFLFMGIYYRRSGLIADFALVLNILYVLTILVGFNSALSLPGLAGLALTVGMAVDANVLIFERIREELRAGKSVRVAVDNGYSKAFSTIFDSNITTALAAVILMNYTTGPIYGFAVTLLAGIAVSMFTAIVVTRMVYRLWLDRRSPETLSI